MTPQQVAYFHIDVSYIPHTHADMYILQPQFYRCSLDGVSTHQHHIASFWYLANILLTISTTPHSHRHVQCTLYKHNSTDYGVQRNTPPSSANINRLNWEGGCYVSRILLISHWQNHTNINTNTATHKHMKLHYWKTPTLRTTHRNPKTRTHKIQTSIKTHKHWQTLMDRPKTAVPYILGFHVTAFFVLQSAQYPANP